MGKVVASLFKIPITQCDLGPCKMPKSMLCFYDDKINVWKDLHFHQGEEHGRFSLLAIYCVGRNDLRN